MIEAEDLADALGPRSEGIRIMQVVPFPTDESLPIVTQYRAALKAAYPETKPDFISLEGYISARIALRGLKAAGQDVTRPGFMQAMQGLGTFDLEGIEVSYGPDDNQGLSAIFVTEMDGAGGYRLLEN